MSKTSETKNKILSLLAERDMRLVDICPKLNLRSATVIQHLKELETMNLIQKVNDSHFKNVKYYRLNREGAPDTQKNNSLIKEAESSRSRLIFMPIVIILLLGAIAYLLIAGSAAQNQKSMALELLMSSPANIPNGTNNIILSYSSVSVHFNGTGGSGWVNTESKGKIELMSVANSSVFMGHVQIPENDFINGAKFNITSASIEIDNVTYPVSIPESTVNAYIENNQGKINETMGIMVEFSPTISRMNNTEPDNFILTYSIKAIKI